MKEVTVEHICTMPQYLEGWHGRTSSPSGHVCGRVRQLVPDNQDIKIHFKGHIKSKHRMSS